MSIAKSKLRLLAPSLCLAFCASSAFAATVFGTVTNRTTGKPSAGDTVGVINTAVSMDEITKVKSDAGGKFHADAPDGGQILLHITHNGAEYFKSVQPGTTSVDVDVFDSATKVTGITGQALVIRTETDASGKTLNVTENFFVQNASAPPRTEFGGDTFDFYLPKGAELNLSLASGPGGLPTNTKVRTVDAATGHYAFTFPVRPGDNRFQVVYSLPYSGKQDFSLKLSVPTGDVIIMIPKSMQFQGSADFQPINNPDISTPTYDAHQPSFVKPIQFSLSGTGQLPLERGPAGGEQSGNSPASGENTAAGGTRPGGGLGAPMDPSGQNDPWSKYKWLILGGLGLALFAGAGIMLKSGQSNSSAPGTGAAPLPYPDGPVDAFAPNVPSTPLPGASPTQGSLLAALKDELFELETDRLNGKITAAQYAEHKAAFDVVLRRALARIEEGAAASNQ